MKLKVKMPIGIGICSLVMMFIAVTMASIISLILMTSHRETQLTQKSIETTKAYYQAEASANAVLLEIGEVYDIYYTASSARGDVFEKALSQVANVTKVELGELSYIYYEVPINDRQVLEVVVQIELKDSDIMKVNHQLEESNQSEERQESQSQDQDTSDKQQASSEQSEEVLTSLPQGTKQSLFTTTSGATIQIMSWKVKNSSIWTCEEESFGEIQIS